MKRSTRKARGFTLIEVMIALAILGAALTGLLRSMAVNVAATHRTRQVAVAAELARAKMYEIEEKLLKDGYPQIDEENDGDFEEEGFKAITWKSEILKIELPDIQALQSFGEEGQEGQEGGEESGGGVLGSILGSAGGGLGGADGGMGSGLITMFYTTFQNILKESVRKVVLTVSYSVMGEEESFQLTCYFTDPSAAARVANLGPGQAAGSQGSGSSTSGGGTSSTGGSTGRGSSTGTTGRGSSTGGGR